MDEYIHRQLGPFLESQRGRFPVVTLTGPRQSGKTTLCRQLFADLPYVNLEDIGTRERVMDDPRAFLDDLPGGAVIDEFQRFPDLTSHLMVRVDEPAFDGFFVLTGSCNLSVRNVVSQSLAGRTALACLLPLSLDEIATCRPDASTDDLIFTGGYPRIWHRGLPPAQVLADYVTTYVERDLHQLSQVRNLSLFQKFLGLCAGRVGHVLNLAGLGNDTGIAQPTAQEWLTLLEATYIAFRLPPFHANISKRLIKSPKLYFYDVGLACHLMGITDRSQLATHPLRGMLFENLAVVEALKFFHHRGRSPRLFFYRDHKGEEVDLVIPRAREQVAVEIKAGSTIQRDFFKGLDRFADLFPGEVERILVHGGDEDHPRRGSRVTPLAKLGETLGNLFPDHP